VKFFVNICHGIRFAGVLRGRMDQKLWGDKKFRRSLDKKVVEIRYSVQLSLVKLDLFGMKVCTYDL
jgi:hypothetical protein